MTLCTTRSSIDLAMTMGMNVGVQIVSLALQGSSDVFESIIQLGIIAYGGRKPS